MKTVSKVNEDADVKDFEVLSAVDDTAHELRVALGKVLKLDTFFNPKASDDKRRVFVHTNYSAYGKLSSVTIEWLGSPARLPIYLRVIERHVVNLNVIAAIGVNTVKGKQCLALINKFLVETKVVEAGLVTYH